jgi:hypothetical protein
MAWRRDTGNVFGVLLLEDRRRLEVLRYENSDKAGQTIRRWFGEGQNTD